MNNKTLTILIANMMDGMSSIFLNDLYIGDGFNWMEGYCARVIYNLLIDGAIDDINIGRMHYQIGITYYSNMENRVLRLVNNMLRYSNYEIDCSITKYQGIKKVKTKLSKFKDKFYDAWLIDGDKDFKLKDVKQLTVGSLK